MVKHKRQNQQREHEARAPFEEAERPGESLVRSLCLCLGQLHKVVGNCLACGKVVCERESYSDCLFCQTPLSGADQADSRFPDLLSKAIEDKQKLLQFQAEAGSRKNMIDDQNDWYDLKNNVWASKEARREADLRMAEKERAEAEAGKYVQYDIDMATGEVKGREVRADLGNEKEKVREYMASKEAESRLRELKLMGQSKVEDEALRSALKGIQDELRGAEKSGKRPSANPQRSHVVQNDDAFDVLLEYGKAMKEWDRRKLGEV